MEPHGSPTTKELRKLRKKHPSIPVGVEEIGSRGGEDSQQGGGSQTRQGGGWQRGVVPYLCADKLGRTTEE